MKGKTPFAIILFFHAGFTPKEIIAKKYPASTVYKYHSIYKEALKEFRAKK
jgi:hypothetical protein